MQLQFVDNEKIDAVTRKQIRRQVMIGRNAGKKRRRARKENKPLVSLAAKEFQSDLEQQKLCLDRLASRRWDEFATFSYPGDLDFHLRRTLRSFMMSAGDILYPKELCLDKAGVHSIFFELFQSDEAFFHCLIAVAEGQRQLRDGSSEVSEVSLLFLAKTYHSINEYLKTNQEPTYGIAASVMSLVMHENLFGMTGRSQMHLDALERIVHLKGGLKAFQRHRVLLHKILRCDLEYALQTGAQPRFYQNAYPRKEVQEALCASSSPGQKSVDIEDDVIDEVFQDCMDVSHILNGSGSSNQLDPFSFQEILISVTTRLLHAYPLDAVGPKDEVDNLCYLCILALVTTMFIRGGVHHQEYYHLLAGRLRASILHIATDNHDLRLWVYYVTKIAIIDKDSAFMWLEPLQRSLASDARSTSLSKVRQVLMKFPWINYFHDEPTKKVFWQMNTALL